MLNAQKKKKEKHNANINVYHISLTQVGQKRNILQASTLKRSV